MTLSADDRAAGSSGGLARSLGRVRPWLGPIGLALVVLVIVAACVGEPAATPRPDGTVPTPSPLPPLRPAEPGADPVSLIAWLFTPIFQALLIVLVGFYELTGDIGIAIVLLTIVVRTILIPLFRAQTVSQRRMQMLQPEIREVQRRYKGDRQKAMEAQQALFRERNVNPASGCLPLLLQLPLLFIIYAVISNGLTNQDPRAMLAVGDLQIVQITCSNLGPQGVPDPSLGPCIDPNVEWLGGLDVSRPQILFPLPLIEGLSLLALVAALLQLVQSRMALPPSDPATADDPNVRIQRQMMLFLPLISVFYGGFLPAGLFIYWIVTTVFSIVQQYLIIGWGSMFPIFGWDPGFARDHTPRFPVAVPVPDPSKRKPGAPTLPDDRATSAGRTIRPARRGRQGRRGRRR